MHISAFFIARPVATTLFTCALVLAGIIAFNLLPVSPLPQVDFPTISVSANLPGADPQTMSTSVAAPLERQFGRIAGVTEMTSTSIRGATNITLQFELDRDIDGAARDVQGAINAARGFLPANLPRMPGYRKVNPSDAPILILALTSDSMEKPAMYDAASNILLQRLSQVEGVGQVLLGGGSLPAVRVELNPLQLNSYGISLDQVRGAIAETSTNRPLGALASADRSWELRSSGQFNSAQQYLPLVIAYRSGAAVRLSDVARVEDSVEDVRTAGFVNGKAAVTVIMFRQPGANIIATVDQVRDLLPQLKAALPGAIDLTVVLDRTPPIRGSLHHVGLTLAISSVLVILVVFWFLRDLRATAIPALAVAVSIIGSFAVMYLCGYSLDNLSLMALTIATGFVVDDAIVVLENITRYREMGQSPMEAAHSGSREIAFTVFSMSLSLVAVFIPILLMEGMVGRLFREFAVTLSAAVLISLVVSLTLTPMMCARFLRPDAARRQGSLLRSSERMFNWLQLNYEITLRSALRHSRLMLALMMATVAVSGVLFSMIPKGFFPEQDTGRIFGNIRAAQDISFQAMSEKLEQVVALIRTDPEVQHVAAFTGGGGTTNTARMFIALKPFETREASASQVINRLRGKISSVPGAPTYLQPVQDLRVGGRISSALYQYTLQGDEPAELNLSSQRLLARLRSVPQLVDLSSDLQNEGREANLVIDRPGAARLGVTTEAIDSTLYNAFGQRQVAVSYTLLNQYHVVMEVAPEFRQSPEMLREINVPAADGTLVPLAAFSRFERSASALAVNHQGQFPSVTLSFNLAPDVALGDAVQAITEATREIGLPAGTRGSFSGTAQAFQASLANQPFLILVALIAVYIVLGILYESYMHPLTILSTLPSAGVGAALALMMFRVELSLIAIIGVILLIGIVKKNGILMVDFALAAQRNEGKSPEEAIFAACLLRFRPIMMTTMAALFGALPLALGTGIGSELRRPLGISIVGGLIFSQMLTLYTTPVVYLYMDRLRLWIGRRRGSGGSERHNGTDWR